MMVCDLHTQVRTVEVSIPPAKITSLSQPHGQVKKIQNTTTGVIRILDQKRATCGADLAAIKAFLVIEEGAVCAVAHIALLSRTVPHKKTVFGLRKRVILSNIQCELCRVEN